MLIRNPREREKIQCWNCGEWITRQGNVCAFCGADKERSRQEAQKNVEPATVSNIGKGIGMLVGLVAWLLGSGLLVAFIIGVIVFNVVKVFVSSDTFPKPKLGTVIGYLIGGTFLVVQGNFAVAVVVTYVVSFTAGAILNYADPDRR